MKMKITPQFLVFFLGLILFSPLSLKAQSLWQDQNISNLINSRSLSTPDLPDKYRTLSLDQAGMQDILWQAPSAAENTGDPMIIDIPLPEGGFDRFEVFETNVFNEELARQYASTIKTFAGQKVDDPAISIRLSLSPIGFYATVFSGGNTYMVEPIANLQDLYYMSYRKADYPSSTFVCKAESIRDQLDHLEEEKSVVPTALRQYRLVYVPTGEFSQQFGVVPPGSGGTPTIANVQASIATSVNIANGVFIRDVAIKLQNNTPNSLIFLNAATDPYDPTNSSAMLTVNQTQVDNAVGTANYDIGHVVAFGNFGGVAVADVCGANNKAMGYSSGDTPLQQITIDYFCHEAGHQFGASHTFSATSCGTAVSHSQYEPGEGNTIMAYANVCNAMDRIQSFSDPFFHCRSINQMNAFITSNATCNTTPVNTGNPEDPTVNCCSTLSIPKNTPFVLVGTTTDATDQATLVSDWEQFDLAPATTAGPVDCNQTMGPNFRARPATASGNRRIFPATAPQGDNDEPWERLSCVARTMNFQLVARDNNSNWGRTAKCSTTVTVTNEGPFAVSAPNGGETVSSGMNTTVTWGGVSASSCATVDIFLSLDGGNNYPIALAINTPNDGSESVSINSPQTSNAKILVQCHTTDGAFLSSCTFFDASNANFTINSNCQAATTNICPTNAMTFSQGDAGLNLSLNNIFGSPISTKAFNIDNGDPTAPRAVATTSGGTSCTTVGTRNYEMLDIVPSVSGTYTFTISPFSNFVIASLFTASGFNPMMPCSSTFLGSSGFDGGGGNVQAGGSFTATLNACTTYKLLVYGNPAFTESVNFSGPGTLFESGTGPGTNYSYTYVAVNTSNNQIVAQSTSSDFTNLGAGTYCIYGASYKSGGPTPPANVDPAAWTGMTISQILSAGQCVTFSSNCKPITITSSCTISSVSATTPVCTGTSANFTVSATVAGGSGNYNVVNVANNAVLGTLTGGATAGTININATFANATGQTLMVKVVDTGMNGCMSISISINLPNCAPTCDIMISSTTPTAETCPNANNGTITIVATSSNPPITYTISGPTNATNMNGSFTGLTPGMYSVTVTDALGASCSATASTTVNAATPIQLSETHTDVSGCPGNNNGAINLTVSGGVSPYTYSWTSNGGSGQNPTTEDQNSLTAGTYTVVVTDNNNCSATTSVTINDGVDNVNPSLTCPATITLNCNISEAPPYNSLTAFQTAGGNASDNCALNTSTFNLLSETTTVVDPCSGGTYTRTYQIMDASGNAATCTQSLILPPVAGPSITCIPNSTVECETDIQVSEADISVSVACNQDYKIDILGPQVYGKEGCPTAIYEYTYVVTDDCGSSASCTRFITIDNAAPTISCTPNQTVSCSADIEVSANDISYTTSCGYGAEVTVSGPVINGSADCPGSTYTYTYRVQDQCGRATTCERIFTIAENAGPTISCLPNQTIACAYQINLNTAFVEVTTSCGADYEISIGEPTIIGTPDCPGTTYTYEYTVTDACGRSASCQRIFTIANDGPELSCPDNELFLNCEDYGGATGVQQKIQAWIASVGAYSSCDIPLGVQNDYHPNNLGMCISNPFTTVTFWATDQCGRTSSCTGTIVMTDTEAPEIMEEAQNETASCYDNYPLMFQQWLANHGGAIAIDGCWENLSWSTIPSFPSINCNGGSGSTTVTFVASDGCGNTTSTTATFSVSTGASSIGKTSELYEITNQESNQLQLLQNRPNPFKNSTTIGFYIPESSEATLNIYDISGRLVKEIRQYYTSGYHEVQLDKNDLTGYGVFIYRLHNDNEVLSQKMIVLE